MPHAVPHAMPGAFAVPRALDPERPQIWLEQQIWGHRFYNDQTPWLLLLEALGLMACRAADRNCGGQVFPGVSAGCDPSGSAESASIHESMRYELKAARRLRRILFADRGIEDAAQEQAVSDAVLWDRWLAGAGEAEFGYLRARFARFSGFRNAVALLRGSEVEPQRKRRLTSRHLAPCGPAMLCADYGEARRGPGTNSNINKDRRFFARGGELLFLMLNRSGRAEALEPLVKRRLLSPRSRWNRLAERLAPPEPDAPVTFDTGYLPLPRHRAYKALGRDWLSLLSLDALPDDHLSEPLMRLSALAAVRYIAERAAEVLGEDRPLMPIDTMGPETAGLRKLSRAAFARHRDMTRRAIERVADDFIAFPAWVDACRQHNPTKAALELVRAHFGFEPKEPGSRTLAALPHAIKEAALDNHEQHLGRVMGFYAEQIGLAARRGASRWYVLGDPLLEAVVLGNVAAPVEYEAFLALLHGRYGFVIGTEAAGRHYTHVNYQQVKANQQHLEDRLRMLGLLKRLSDDCAFVINPFWTERT